MTIKMYSLYDKKTQVYGRPFFAHNDGHAVRLIQDELADNSFVVARHPDDFSLHCVGAFDDATGNVESMTPSKVMDCDQLKGPEKDG